MMWIVLVLLQLVTLGGSEQWSVNSKMSKQDCDTYMTQSDPQAETILECLTTHYSLTRLLGQVHEKMDRIEQKLNEALKKNKKPTTPYKHIDDILNIKEISKDCQSQNHILRALRRKLEWYNLMNHIDTTTQFEGTRTVSRPKIRSLTKKEEPAQKLFRKGSRDAAVLDGVQCIVTNSLRSSDVGSRSKLLLEKYQRENKDKEGSEKR